MKRAFVSVSAISLACLVAACATEDADRDRDRDGTGGTGMSGSGGSSGNSSGAAGKGGAGGSAPGTGGTNQAGTAGAGSPAGSAGVGGSVNPAGGAPTGGANPAGGVPAGGTDGLSGSSGGPTGGAGDVGGAGGTGGTGGTPMGGAAGTTPSAGAAGSAGTPPVIDEPTLVTSANNDFWKVGNVTEVTSGSATVTVNDGQASQTFSGFGGTFNEKGWEALAALNEADRATAIKLLFDAAEGAKFVYGRIPIGASDYATNRYTLNDTAGDTAMTNFSIDRDRMRLIPYIKAAQAVNPNIYFWGSPWTPPPWMKDNNAYDKGNMKSDAATLGAFALYLAKFVEEYATEGIVVKAIHPQNEPGFVQDYPSCSWSGSLMATFIGTHLGPTFQQRGVAAEIFIGTMSNSTADASVLNTVMGNATAKGFVRGHGLQWGMINVWSSLQLDRNLPIWQTEHKCGNYPWVSGTNQSRAPNDMAYGVESWGLIRDWIKRGVTAYSAWNMVLDTVGRSLDTVRPWAQNAPLVVDIQAKRLIITPTYYVFRHVSQYVDPGAKLVGTSGGDALAFKNPDGSIVTVMYNSGGARQTIVSVGGKLLQFDMPGSGWATVNWPAQ